MIACRSVTERLRLALYALLVCSCEWLRGLPRPVLFPATDERVLVMGRAERTQPNALRLGYPGVTLRLAFEGSWLAVRALSEKTNRFAIRVDGAEARTITLRSGVHDTLLVKDLPRGQHELELVRLNETWQGTVTLRGFILENSSRLLPARPFPTRRLLFIGDSITCGEAIDRPPDCGGSAAENANAAASYGMLLARAVDAQCQLVCYGGRGLMRDWQGRSDVLNAPQFFELSVPDARKPPYDPRDYPADAVFISLGTNDANTLSDADGPRFVATYVDFLRRIRAAYPKAHLFITEGAMLNDGDPRRPLKTRLRNYLWDVHQRLRDPRVHVVPSQHYPGDACNAHPTREQHAQMARDFEPGLRRTLGWR